MLSRSYTHGTTNHPMWYITLPDLLDQRAKEYPDKDVHVFWTGHDEGKLLRESITYQDLAERSYNLAASLLGLGLEPGDRIAIAADNCLEWTLVEYAAMRCKLLLVRIPPDYVTPEILAEFIVEYSCKAIIVDGRKKDKVTQITIREFMDDDATSTGSRSRRIIALKQSNSKLLTVTEMSGAAHAPRRLISEVKALQNSVKPDDVAVVLTPSGNNGIPQLIKLSHFAIINNARCVDQDILSDPDARYYNASPFFWVGSNMYASLSFGITMVHLDKTSQKDLQQVSAVLSAENVTVGKFMASFLQEAYELTLTGEQVFPVKMQYIITGGAALNKDITAYFQRHFKGILEDYGATETLSVATSFTTRGTFGHHYKPVPNVEIKVVNESEETLPVNQPGCLWVKSPFLFRGYLEKDGCDQDVISGDLLHNGWYNTWDVAQINEHGGVEIVGRYHNIIKQGTRVIFPERVEEKIESLSCVEEVSVVGVPPNSSDQDICACVIAEEGCNEEELRVVFEELRVKWDLEYSVKYILLLEEFPKVPDGKVNKRELVKNVMKHIEK